MGTTTATKSKAPRFKLGATVTCYYRQPEYAFAGVVTGVSYGRYSVLNEATGITTTGVHAVNLEAR